MALLAALSSVWSSSLSGQSPTHGLIVNSSDTADIEPRLPTPTSAQVPGSSGASVIPVRKSVKGAMTVVPHVPGSVQVACARIGSGCTQTAPPLADATQAHNVS